MSSTRENEKALLSAPSDWKRGYAKAIFVGGVVGSFSNMLTHCIDKIIINLQNGGSNTLLQAGKRALGNGNALKGLGTGQVSAITKNVVLFPLMQLSQQHIENSMAANFLAATVATYVLAPMNFVKTIRYGNQPFSTITQTSDLFKGVHATAGRDSIQYGVYFSVIPIVSQVLKEKFHIENVALSGVIAGGIGSIFSNPLAVIATRQKLSEHPVAMHEVAKSLYRSGGVKAFYPLFLTSSFIRVGLVQGGAIAIAKKQAERAYPAVEEFIEEKAGQSRTRP